MSCYQQQVCVRVCTRACLRGVCYSVTVFTLRNTVAHRAQGGLRAVGAPACRDSCAELTNPATWALRAWRPVQARSGQARGGTGCAPIFGLWRVCFPPCLVRPGRRLPRAVQGLSAERLVNLPVCVSSIVGYCTVSTNTEEPSRVMPTKSASGSWKTTTGCPLKLHFQCRRFELVLIELEKSE